MSKPCVKQVQIVVGAFLTFSFSLLSSDLKVPNISIGVERGSEVRFGTNYKEAREFKV